MGLSVVCVLGDGGSLAVVQEGDSLGCGWFGDGVLGDDEDVGGELESGFVFGESFDVVAGEVLYVFESGL
jgi:hypothetical protein